MKNGVDIELLRLHLSAYVKDDSELDMYLHYYEHDSHIHSALDRFADLPSLNQQMTLLDEIKRQILTHLN